jgi:predicted neuraminidase
VKLPTATATCLLLAAAFGARADFLTPPQHAGPPLPEHALPTRAFQGIPSLAVAPNGRLWAAWYAGKTPGEDQNNYVVLATSGDDGLTWRDVLTVDPDGTGPVRAFDPEMWLGPDGRLRLFWAQAVGHDLTVGGVWCMETAAPGDAAPAWQPPRRLTDGVMMCKPLVLSTGEWALPAATWSTDNSAKMVVSLDTGAIWSLRGACNVPAAVRNCDEHMLVERKDGLLWMLVRTTYGIGESLSADRGATWPELTPSAIAHPTARFFVSRLASGNLLLVKHGPIGTRTGRSHLTAFLSANDGATWEGGLLLDERSGVSYPDGQQSADGLIRIVYDYNRTTDRQILMAVFREEDVVAGQAVSGAVRLRQTVSSFRPPAVGANRDGQPLRQAEWGAWSAEGADAVPFVRGERLFTDSDYTANELPAALDDALPTRRRARFLRLPLRGAPPVLTCARAGTVYVLTPAPERDAAASQSAALAAQGFAKARLPEVRLLGPTAVSGFCTVYQKTCAQGEQVTLGAWSVPFFFQ